VDCAFIYVFFCCVLLLVIFFFYSRNGDVFFFVLQYIAPCRKLSNVAHLAVLCVLDEVAVFWLVYGWGES
jgi:hypothetical protein